MSAINGIKILDSLADDPQKQMFCSTKLLSRSNYIFYANPLTKCRFD